MSKYIETLNQLKSLSLDFATRTSTADVLDLAKSIYDWLSEDTIKEEAERIKKRDEHPRAGIAEETLVVEADPLQGSLFD